MRNLLIGAAGSALVLAIDLGVTHWGNENILLRIGSAAAAFVAFFIASVLLPWKDSNKTFKRILSGIRAKGNVDIDANGVKSPRASEVLSDIKAKKDVKIKAGEIET